MGTYQKSVLGNFTGKVGQLVYTSWKGRPVVKSAPKKRTGKRSELQIMYQVRFSLIIKFLRPLSDFFNQTHKFSKFNMTGYNKMVSENLRTAITGDYPELAIDYSRLILSKGNLSLPKSLSAAPLGEGKIEFTWIADGGGYDYTNVMDHVFVVIYHEITNRWMFNDRAAVRGTGSCILDAAVFSGKTVQAYIGFIAASQRRVSDSMYLGTVNVL